MAERVLEFAEALEVVLREAAGVSAARGAETVELLEAAGRVLAEPVVAGRDQPPFDRATRDGFALRAGEEGQPLRVVGQVRAGERWRGAALGAGEAVEIMTGAPMPEGANAVVMVEHVSVVEGVLRVEAGRRLRAGENVVARGAEARAGAGVLPVGRAVGAAEIAVAASCGRAELRVFARPRVAIVATGDELVELGTPGAKAPSSSSKAMKPDPEESGYPNGAGEELGEAEIYNSNSYALAALVRGEGGEALRLAVARDTLGDLRARLEEAKGAELLLLTGGVSMGRYDLVEQALAEAGAEFFFTGVRIQPGKPVVFGRFPDGRYFFGLPGNPVSAQVCFALFVGPLLRAMAGRAIAGTAGVAPVFVEAKLAEDVKGGAGKPSGVTRFLPAELSGSWDGVTVRVVAWQGSGDVGANARGNGYCVLPSGVEGFKAGETVRVLLR